MDTLNIMWGAKKKSKIPFTKDIPSLKRYKIGDFTYGEPQILDWNNDGCLSIGRFCSIAKGVKIFLGGNHRVDWISTYPFSRKTEYFNNASEIIGHPTSKGPVSIGNDVWIGSDVTILSGVSIGDGAVIGARSLVSKDIPPYSVVGGNPAKILRNRFSSEQIEKLLKISWWNWPIDKINNEVKLICNTDVQFFIDKHWKN